jgi:hypothetical protein
MHIEYARYGARGIKVCDRWNDFALFLADMGLRPSPMHSIDRWPDGNGNYAPGNCRWATPTQQQRNKRNSTMLTYKGRRMHSYDWALRLGLSVNTIKKRLKLTRDPALLLRPSRGRSDYP